MTGNIKTYTEVTITMTDDEAGMIAAVVDLIAWSSLPKDFQTAADVFHGIIAELTSIPAVSDPHKVELS